MLAAVAFASVGVLSVVTGAVTVPLHGWFLDRGSPRAENTGPRSRLPRNGGAQSGTAQEVRTLRTVVAPEVALARRAQGLSAGGHAPEPPPTPVWRVDHTPS